MCDRAEAGERVEPDDVGLATKAPCVGGGAASGRAQRGEHPRSARGSRRGGKGRTHNLKLPVERLARADADLSPGRERAHLPLRAHDLFLDRHGAGPTIVRHREDAKHGRQGRVGPKDGAAGAEGVRGEDRVVDKVGDREREVRRDGVEGEDGALAQGRVVAQGGRVGRQEGLEGEADGVPRLDGAGRKGVQGGL